MDTVYIPGIKPTISVNLSFISKVVPESMVTAFSLPSVACMASPYWTVTDREEGEKEGTGASAELLGADSIPAAVAVT